MIIDMQKLEPADESLFCVMIQAIISAQLAWEMWIEGIWGVDPNQV